MSGAYVVAQVSGAVSSSHDDTAPPLADLLEELLASSGVRSTDVHDVVVACDDVTPGSPVSSTLASLMWPGTPTYGFHFRGHASALDALSCAHLGAVTEHRDVSLVLAVASASVPVARARAGESSAPRYAAGVVVASDYYVTRSRCDVLARVRRVVSASHSSRRLADSLYEAAVRLLMNETMNANEVDDWRLWPPNEASTDPVDRLGLDRATVTDCSATWPPELSPAPAALNALIQGVATAPLTGGWTCVTVVPGLAGSAVAAMVERI